MRRAGWIAAAIVGWSVCASNPGFAQAPPPEGWVVLSIDEYRTLRILHLGQLGGKAGSERSTGRTGLALPKPG